jgi:mannose-6-phosphate isomerase-like protein (cupin superfamily)
VLLSGPAGQQVAIKISGVASRGAYSLIEYSQPSGAPDLPAHLHRDHEEAFYVIEGELTLAVGEFGESLVAVRGGQAAVVPRSVIHRPVNVSNRPVRFLLISSPPMDGFFAELA